MADKVKSIRIVENETALQSWTRDASSFVLAVALIGTGIWLGSTAIEWIGALVFLVVSVSAGGKLIKTMTIEDARNYLDELEKGQHND